MIKLKTVLCASLMLGLTSAASAQDWSGFYVGPQVSYTWMNTSWQFNNGQPFTTANSSDSFSTHPDGFTMGPHIGWAQQIDAWVVGIEGAYDGGSFSDKKTGAISSTYPNDTFNTKVNQMYSITPLVGYALDEWMFYAKGGYVSAKVQIDADSENPHAGTYFSDSQRQYGWTAGVGMAYQLNEKQSVGLEYNYSRLGSTDFTATTTGAESVQDQITVQHININTVALIYSYHFG